MLYKSFPGTVELRCQALAASREVQGINCLFAVADCWGWDALRCRSTQETLPAQSHIQASLHPFFTPNPPHPLGHACPKWHTPHSFHLLVKIHQVLHACLQASHLRDLDKIHTCNFNQLDPLDVELKMRWISLLSVSLALFALRLFAFLNERNSTNGG